MTITIINKGYGVGINSVYGVMRDGILIATIKRTGIRTSWGIYSHYHEVLWVGPNVEAAKARALTIYYPTKAELYEKICQQAERNRRIKLEEQHAHDLARLGREMVAGSNSARVEFEELLAAIERDATDRTATGPNRAINSYKSWLNTQYPEPPQEKHVEEAA